MTKRRRLAASEVIRITQALGHLLSLDDNHKINRVKLMKLLWAADRFHMRKYGRTVSQTDYSAMPHGPVASLALDIAKLNGDFALSEDDIEYISTYFTADQKDTAMSLSPGDDHLSETDKEALDFAWTTFGKDNAFKLADDKSHKYPEWSKHKNHFKVSRDAREIDVADFFKNPPVVDDDPFREDDDKLHSAEALFVDEKNAKDELYKALGM